MCWSERVLDLLDRWQNFGRVEVKSAVPKTNEFHVEYFDGLQSLRNWIENQSQPAQWQVNDEITAERILQVTKTKEQVEQEIEIAFNTVALLVRCTKSGHFWWSRLAFEWLQRPEKNAFLKERKTIFFIIVFQNKEQRKKIFLTQNKFPSFLRTAQASFRNHFKIKHFNLSFATLTLWKSNCEGLRLKVYQELKFPIFQLRIIYLPRRPNVNMNSIASETLKSSRFKIKTTNFRIHKLKIKY